MPQDTFDLDQKKQKELEEALFKTDKEKTQEAVRKEKKIRKMEDYENDNEKLKILEKKLEL